MKMCPLYGARNLLENSSPFSEKITSISLVTFAVSESDNNCLHFLASVVTMKWFITLSKFFVTTTTTSNCKCAGYWLDTVLHFCDVNSTLTTCCDLDIKLNVLHRRDSIHMSQPGIDTQCRHALKPCQHTLLRLQFPSSNHLALVQQRPCPDVTRQQTEKILLVKCHQEPYVRHWLWHFTVYSSSLFSCHRSTVAFIVSPTEYF